LQAAIAAVHARAARKEDTDWSEIAGLYEILERVEPSPIVTLNRAVAVAMIDGPRAALSIIDGVAEALDAYHLLHAARADLLRRLGAYEEAVASYKRALSLVGNESERRFLSRRLRELSGPDQPASLQQRKPTS
jgi:RNA polymerase sigma-70 factor (ECF subfamily)